MSKVIIFICFYKPTIHLLPVEIVFDIWLFENNNIKKVRVAVILLKIKVEDKNDNNHNDNDQDKDNAGAVDFIASAANSECKGNQYC